MTDFGGRQSVGKVSAKRQTSVWQGIGLCVSISLGFVAASATESQAGYADPEAWTVFQSRCLDPMSRVGRADVAGLEGKEPEFYDAAWYDAAVYDRVSFRVTDELELAVLSQRDGPSKACVIATLNPDIALPSLAAADHWWVKEVESSRWHETASLLSGPMLERAWDSPVTLRFVMDSYDGTLVFALYRIEKEG